MNKHIRFGDYIIDPQTLGYRAVWNCQVEFSDDCIYYDAEVGNLVLDGNEIFFSCLHKLHVTKADYKRHEKELQEIKEVQEADLFKILNAYTGDQVIN